MTKCVRNIITFYKKQKQKKWGQTFQHLCLIRKSLVSALHCKVIQGLLEFYLVVFQ